MPKTEEKMTLKPLGDKVVVEIIDEPQTTASGIVLPDTAKEKSQRGKVLAVGAGKLLENGERAALEVSEGDTVLFAKYGGTEITIAGKDLMILSERDIHAVVE
jgi:chaperonin GroES